MLLAELITYAGYDVRLARADLDKATGERLLASVGPPPTYHDVSAPESIEDVAAFLAGDMSSSLPEIRAELEAAALTAEACQAAINERVTEQTRAILSVLGENAIDAGDIDQHAVLLAVQDHWWVQYFDGDAWLDADSSAMIVGGLEPDEVTAIDDLPDGQFHRVTMRLLLEVWNNGEYTTNPVFDYRFRVADVIGRSITLTHRPVSSADIASYLGDSDSRESLLQSLSESWAWLPVLTIDGEEITDGFFTFYGDIQPATPQNLNAIAGTSVGDLGESTGNLLGGGLTSGAQTELLGPPDESSVRVSAEWLEIEINTPGASVERHRRDIFDLVGPSARTATGPVEPMIDSQTRRERALSLIAVNDVMLMPADPAPDYLARWLAVDMAQILRFMANALNGELNAAEIATKADELPRLPIALIDFFAGRQVMSEAMANSFLEQSNIVLLRHAVADGADGGLQVSVDIVANARSPYASSGDTFAARIEYGVADTVLETLVLGGDASAGNTSALFATDLSAGRDWRVLTADDQDTAARLEWPADARARLSADLAAGYTIVAPSRPILDDGRPQVAWWRVDPSTGTTLGIGSTGRGQATAEYVSQAATIFANYICFLQLVDEIAGAERPAHILTNLMCFFGSATAVMGQGLKLSALRQVGSLTAHQAHVTGWMTTIGAVIGAAGGGLSYRLSQAGGDD